MNIEKLIESLSEEEKSEAYISLCNWNRETRKANAVKIKLTREEKETARKDKISAIRAVRNRNACLLMEAKIAVENYLKIDLTNAY
jgi:ribosomal protein L7/L12